MSPQIKLPTAADGVVTRKGLREPLEHTPQRRDELSRPLELGDVSRVRKGLHGHIGADRADRLERPDRHDSIARPQIRPSGDLS